MPTRTVTGFGDDCVGLDCNGFVNNYLGFDRDKSIDTYDVNYPKSRRQTLREVVAGDAERVLRSAPRRSRRPESVMAAGAGLRVAAGVAPPGEPLPDPTGR